ncbi:MAG: hypothetical protein K1060chlam5_00990 [Candidatus Anoxychlamydiales bacterium]|nr:hypothetical protein [Candidatus Anoxychlamydiales bacterium]
MNNKTFPLSDLRGTDLAKKIAKKTFIYTMPFSSENDLTFGGTLTFATYKNFYGFLTATHVLAKHLNIKEIFAPSIKTNDPNTYFIKGIPIKKIRYLETSEGIKLLSRADAKWNSSTLDICFIEIDENIFNELLKESNKQVVDLQKYQEKYSSNFKKYCALNNNWCWGIVGFPREQAKHDKSNIIISKFDGPFFSGGQYKTDPLKHVHAPFDRDADRCDHEFGTTKDVLPSNFQGISGGGVWQISFCGETIPEKIDEMFFSGVVVAASPDDLVSRGPEALYNIFLPYLDSLY